MDKRNRILSVGRDILVSAGLRSLTTNEVARRARISKKTLYRYFASKEELAETVVQSFIEFHLIEWENMTKSDAPVMERLRRSFEFVQRVLPRIQASVLNHVEHVDPILWEKVDRIRTAKLSRLKALLIAAQEEGDVRPDIDADRWFFLLLQSVRHVAVPQVLMEAGSDLSPWVDTIRILYFDGLLTDKGRRRCSEARKEMG